MIFEAQKVIKLITWYSTLLLKDPLVHCRQHNAGMIPKDW